MTRLPPSDRGHGPPPGGLFRSADGLPHVSSPVRRALGRAVFATGFEVVSRAGQLHPAALAARRGIRVVRNVSYVPGGGPAHQLDVYVHRRTALPAPCVLYLHGGAFRILSKDSHWMMGLQFAHAGFVVFNASYRLAPRHAYPAALVDALAAWTWVRRNAHRYGGDPDRIVLAGESAGANLALAATVAACVERPEPWARATAANLVPPRALVAFCGVFQVSDMARFFRPDLPNWMKERMLDTEGGYFPVRIRRHHPDPSLADPLRVLEERPRLLRPFPKVLVPIGTRDPLLDDSRRLKTALDRLGVPSELRIYEGGVHAFHAMFWQQPGAQAWRDTAAFLRDLHAPAKGAT